MSFVTAHGSSKHKPHVDVVCTNLPFSFTVCYTHQELCESDIQQDWNISLFSAGLPVVALGNSPGSTNSSSNLTSKFFLHSAIRCIHSDVSHPQHLPWHPLQHSVHSLSPLNSGNLLGRVGLPDLTNSEVGTGLGVLVSASVNRRAGNGVPFHVRDFQSKSFLTRRFAKIVNPSSRCQTIARLACMR